MNRGSIFVILSLIAMTTAVTAAGPAPAYIPIQGYLTDDADRPLDGEHVLHLKLYSSDAAETALFEESQIVLLDRGYFTVYLGMNKPLSLELIRDSDGLVLGFAVDSDPEMTPRLTLGTTPYAAYAEYTGDARTLEGKAASDFRLATDQIDWADLDNIPADMEDGDSDTLQALSCAPGQVSKRSEDAWICADDSLLTQADVEVMVAGLGYAQTSDLAPVAVTGSFTDLTDTPADILDGDNDTLAGLTCVSGQSATFNGTSWVCSNRSRDTLASLSCADGQTAKWSVSHSAWICDADLDTTLTETDVLGIVETHEYVRKDELAWIALSGYFEHLQNVPAGLEDGDDDALGHLQCASGQVAKWGPSGWYCAFDQDTPGDITHVTAGAGLDGGGDVGAVTLNVDPSYVQLRVTGACPAGEAVREIDESGDVVCTKSSLSCVHQEAIASGASADVQCPAGAMATGGGGDCVDDRIITSGPSGNGWRIRCQTPQANIKVWAVCCTLQ